MSLACEELVPDSGSDRTLDCSIMLSLYDDCHHDQPLELGCGFSVLGENSTEDVFGVNKLVADVIMDNGRTSSLPTFRAKNRHDFVNFGSCEFILF